MDNFVFLVGTSTNKKIFGFHVTVHQVFRVYVLYSVKLQKEMITFRFDRAGLILQTSLEVSTYQLNGNH